MRRTVCVVYTHAPTGEMDSPLHAACINGDVSSLAGMLSAVSSRSANDPDTVLGWCPLHFAARFGRQQVVELLLEPPVRTPTLPPHQPARASALGAAQLGACHGECRSPPFRQRLWTRRRRQARRRCTWRLPTGMTPWCSAFYSTVHPSTTATISWAIPHCIMPPLKHAPPWSRCWCSMAPTVSAALSRVLARPSFTAMTSLMQCSLLCHAPRAV